MPLLDVRVLRRGRSSLALAADGAVVRWRSHDSELPLLVDRGADADSGAAFRGALPGGGQDGPSAARTDLRWPGSSVEVQDRLLQAAEPVGRAEPGTALVRLVRCRDAALDVEHELRLLPELRWFALNGLAMGYLDQRKITVDGGAVEVRGPAVVSRLQAPPQAWVAITVTVDGHLPADADRLSAQLRAVEPDHR